MKRTRLDAGTADRILAGAVGPEDAPPGYASVTALLAAARPWPAHDPTRQAATVASMRAVVLARAVPAHGARRNKMLGKLLTIKAAAAAGAVVIGATGAAVATGTLPGAAQAAAANVLSAIGVTVPGPNSHSGTHPQGRRPINTTATTAAMSGAASTTGPSSNADNGLCTASTASAGHPATNATVFPTASTCSTITHPGTGQVGTGDATSPPPDRHPSSHPAGAPTALPGGPAPSLPSSPPTSTHAGAPPSLPSAAHGR